MAQAYRGQIGDCICQPSVIDNDISFDTDLTLCPQGPQEELPEYENYSDGLQPLDDALVQRVILEYWAAFAESAAQHDIAKSDFTKAFRDK